MFRTIHLATLVALTAATTAAQDPFPAATPTLTRPALSITFEVDGAPVAFRIDGDDVKVDGDVSGNTGLGLPSRSASRTVQMLDQAGELLATLHLDPTGLQLRFPPRSQRAWLGVELQPIPPVLADHLELDPQAVALVTRVRPESPAARCGLAENDIVLRVGNRESADVEAVHAAIAEAKPGDSIDIRVLRRGTTKTLAAKLGREPVEDTDLSNQLPFLRNIPLLGQQFLDQADLETTDEDGRDERSNQVLGRLLYDSALQEYLTQRNLHSYPSSVYDRTGNYYLLPHAVRERDLTETEEPVARLDRVEEQLARIEELLRKLEERRDN